MERRFQDNTLAIVVGVGVLLGVTAFGAVIAMLLGKRTAQQLSGFPQFSLPPGDNATDPIPVVQMPTIQTALDTKPTMTATVTLSAQSISRVVNGAGKRHWQATLRNLGPPGSYALVASDSSLLAYPSMCAQIPAGQETKMRVRPGDALFAIGNVNGVRLSVVTSEEIA